MATDDASGGLSQEGDHFRVFFEQAPIGKCMTAPDGRILRANRAMCELLGYSCAELEALRFGDITHPEDQAQSRAMVETLLAGKRSDMQIEKRYIAKDGHAVWARVTTRLLRDAAGEPLRFLTHVQDISEHKRQQAALSDLRVELIEAQRHAMMGMLAAGIGHEINNPLSYLIASLEQVTGDLPELLAPVSGLPRAQDLLHAAESALDGARRIAQVTHRLQAFSRFKNTSKAGVDLHAAVEQAVAMVKHDLLDRATLELDLAPVVRVRGDAGRLTQALMSLLRNAIQALPEGDPAHACLSVRLWQHDHKLYLELTDSGPGFSEIALERAFEPFFTTRPPGQGSGLGLCLARSVVRELGGEITLSNVASGGAKVAIQLPVTQVAAGSAVAEPASGAQPEPTAATPRVLFVDDEPQLRRALRRMFRGIEVIEAGSGAEAIELLRAERFDVILCDMMMPKVSGMEVHAWLAAERPLQAERLIFVTGGVFTSKARDYLARHSVPLVYKPFNVGALRSKVCAVAARPWGDQAGPEQA